MPSLSKSPAKPRSRKGRAALKSQSPGRSKSPASRSKSPAAKAKPAKASPATTKAKPKKASTPSSKKKKTSSKSPAPMERSSRSASRSRSVSGRAAVTAASSYFDLKTFLYELVGCSILIGSFPLPGFVFPTSTILEYFLAAAIVVLNDTLTGAILSPIVAVLLWYCSPPFGVDIPFSILFSTLSAQAVVSMLIYPVKSLLLPSNLIFGPTCASTYLACLSTETYLTFFLTAWCMLPPSLFMLLPSKAKPWVTRVWIAVGIRICITLGVGVSGASMNPFIAAAYWWGGGDLGDRWFEIYILGPITGATAGVAFAGIFKGALKGRKSKED